MRNLLPFVQEREPENLAGLLQDMAYRDPTGQFSNWRGSPFNPDLLVQQKSLDIFDKIRLDDQARAALSFKKLAVTAPGWTIQSAQGVGEDDEVADFVRKQFDELPGTFAHTLHQVLSAMDYGYSITEKVYVERDGKLCLSGLKPKYPHGFDFDVDEFGNLMPDGLLQDARGATGGSSAQRRLPTYKFLIYSYQMEFSNPYGNSDLRTAYRPWWTKDNAYKWLAMLLEKYGIPPIFALYNSQVYQGASVPTEIQTLVNKIRVGTGAAVPRNGADDLEFWTPELAKQVSNTFIPALNLYDRHIARAILMPSLIGMTSDDNVGSLARSNVHFDSFMLVVANSQLDLEAVINEQVVRQLVDLNFTGADYPVFKFNPLTDEIKTELADAWTKLLAGGVVRRGYADENHFREMYKMPPAPEDDELMEAPEPKEEPGDQKAQDDEEDKGDQADTDSKDEEVAKQVQAIQDSQPVQFSQEPFRELTRAEREADVLRLFAVVDDGESEGVDEIKAVLKSAERRTLRWLEGKTELTTADVEAYAEIPNKASLRGTMRDLIAAAMEDGRRTAAEELPKEFAAKDFTRNEQLAYIDAKSIVVADATDQAITTAVKQALLNGISQGQSIRQVRQRIEQIFEDYDGIAAHRAETIVRTNYNAAFNHGRLQLIQDAGSYVHGVQYSAILDTRTTEVCRNLDGKVFEVNAPELDRLTPPRHFQCRSLLVPVMITTPIDQADRINQTQVDRAIEQSGKGF